MELLGSFLSILLLASPLVALCAAAWVYAKHQKLSVASTKRPLLPFIGGVATFAFGFWVMGTLVGLSGFCAIYPQAQCGLVGLFFIGPLAAAFGVILYLFSWVKRGKAL